MSAAGHGSTAAGATTSGAGAAVDDEEAKLQLLEKLKAASKAPEQAARKIVALDKMIGRLKQNRLDCQVAMDEDTEELKWIEREEASIRSRLDPLVARLTERKATAERVREEIKQAEAQFAGILNTTNQRITRTRMSAAEHRKKQAVEELRAERGFSSAAEDSPHRHAKARTLKPSH